MISTFKDIIAWKKGYELTLEIYKLTASFPQSEEFGLKSSDKKFYGRELQSLLFLLEHFSN